MNNLIDFSEILNTPRKDILVESYYKRYPTYFDAYEKARNKYGKVINESISDEEYIAFGKQLLNCEYQLKNLQEARGQTALGAIPTIALDVVTATAAISILPFLTSIQPIDDQKGLVWYRNLMVNQTSGGFTDGELISGPLTLNKVGDGTLGAQTKKFVIEKNIAAGQTYTTNLPAPVVPYRLQVRAGDLGQGMDDGNGKILGFGFKGTIDYKTGVLNITVEDAPTTNKVLEVISSIDTDLAPTLDTINMQMTTKEVNAEIIALKTNYGAMANAAFEKRWGQSASDSIAQDLTNEMIDTLNTRCILEIYKGAIGETTWDRKPYNGVSYLEHKYTMIDSIAMAEAVIHQNTGKGTMNRIIAGRLAASTLFGLEDFQRVTDSENAIGVVGSWKDAIVIRATNAIPDNELIIVSNPQGYWNSPLVYSPYIPLYVTDPISDPSNPLRASQAAAIWSGFTPVNPGLATKFIINNINTLSDTSTNPGTSNTTDPDKTS